MALESVSCHSRVRQGQWIGTLARVSGSDRVLWQIASLSGVVLNVYQVRGSTDDDRSLYTLNLASSDVMFDALQVGGAWDQDSAGTAGYNFSHMLKVGDTSAPGLTQIVLPGGAQYLLEYVLASYAFGPLAVRHLVDVDPLMSL